MKVQVYDFKTKEYVPAILIKDGLVHPKHTETFFLGHVKFNGAPAYYIFEAETATSVTWASHTRGKAMEDFYRRLCCVSPAYLKKCKKIFMERTKGLTSI